MAREMRAIFKPIKDWCECGQKLVDMGFFYKAETIEESTGKRGNAPIMMRPDGAFVWACYCTECGNAFFDLEAEGGFDA